MESIDDTEMKTPEKSEYEKSRIPLSIRTTPLQRSVSNLSRTQICPIFEYETISSFYDNSMHKSSSFDSRDVNVCCDHSTVACNGTTFSGRRKKYLVHCPTVNNDNGEYLTPTQRAQKEVRVLKQMLNDARKQLRDKDSEILRLTNEIVELKLRNNSPDDPSCSSDLITVCENTTRCLNNNNSEAINANLMVQSSYSDSGHYEDCTSSTISSKYSSINLQLHDKSTYVNFDQDERTILIEIYERKLEELIQLHNVETNDLKQKYNDKLEDLLLKLTDINTRYSDLVPNYSLAQDRIRVLENQLTSLNNQLSDQTNESRKLCTEMYNKGLEIGQLESYENILDVKEIEKNHEPLKITKLLEQLEKTQNELENLQVAYNRLLEMQKPVNTIDPEITLKFLKSAIYYYLTDESNYDGHLRAIENILGFTEAEKSSIRKNRRLAFKT